MVACRGPLPGWRARAGRGARPGRTAPVAVEAGEVVERLGDVGVVLAEGRLPDGERALVEWLGPAYNPWSA